MFYIIRSLDVQKRRGTSPSWPEPHSETAFLGRTTLCYHQSQKLWITATSQVSTANIMCQKIRPEAQLENPYYISHSPNQLRIQVRRFHFWVIVFQKSEKKDQGQKICLMDFDESKQGPSWTNHGLWVNFDNYGLKEIYSLKKKSWQMGLDEMSSGTPQLPLKAPSFTRYTPKRQAKQACSCLFKSVQAWEILFKPV